MKKIFILFTLSLFLASVMPNNILAQASEGWAAGHVQLEYVSGTETCSEPTDYYIILQFYRDYIQTGNNLPNSKDVRITSESLNVDSMITLNFKRWEGVVEQFCLNGNPVATEGAWYTTKNPIPVDRADDWVFDYTGEFRSDENNNIFPGQTFGVRTTLNNVPCGTVIDPDDPTNIKHNPPPNSTVTFQRPHPVLSFCSGIGKSYNYEIPARDPDNSPGNKVDNINYGFTSTRDETIANRVTYEPLYSFKNPFPSNSEISPISSNGVISFIPAEPFTSSTSINITESRPWYRIEMIQGTPRLVSSSVAVSSTIRDYRIIFDDNCNNRLPEFEGVVSEYNPQTGQDDLVSTYNSSEDAYEFECGTVEMTFNLSNPMYCNTLDKNDFRIGLGYNGVDTIVSVIDDVSYPSCTPDGEFDQIKIRLHDPIGPGEYNIFFRYGSNDSTTILNRCDFDLPIDSPWVRLYINNEFTYEHPFTDTVYCDPADVIAPNKGIRVRSGFEDGKNYGSGKMFFTWRQNPNDPNSKTDTILPGHQDYQSAGMSKRSFFDVWVDDDNNSKQVVWQVGAGLDFSIYDPFTGDTILERICYDTENFILTRYDNPPVNVPDYDLCPEDDWPLVDLDSMRTDHNALTEDFSWEAFNEFPLDRNKADIRDPSKWSLIEVGKTSLELPGAMLNRYNYFISNVPLLINGRTCIESDTFIVVKEDVRANIGNDSTICPGEEYVLRNDYDYLVPDSMSYEWYFNDELVIGNNTDTIMLDKRGEYKLVVTKNTMVNSICVGKDSVYINIADSLYAPEAICSEVTFENGIIKQKFSWNWIEGADGYQARSIDMNDNYSAWEESNGEPVVFHNVNGAQMRLQARAYNNEVPEDAICRYGPVSNIAEACEVIIKSTNVFTPNGDGVNDYLSFDLLELYPGSKLQVFNRWGKLIYEDDSYYNDWDGDDSPSGTYFYVLDINDEAYGIFKGNFTIIRD